MGRVLTNNTSLQYAVETALGVLDKAIAAVGTLTFTANVADADTVTIGAQVYTFEDAALDAANEVDLGADLDASIDNLVAAINASASGDGTQYATGTTENADVSAVRGAGNTIIVTAKTAGVAGNSVATTETAANASWGAATLEGGLASGSAGAVETEWKLTEPNTINALGAQIATTPRNPISNRRQRRKGSTTDLDSTVEFEADATHDAAEDFFDSWVFATSVNGDLVNRGATVANGQYHIANPFTAAQAAKLIQGAGFATLIFAAGYTAAANNGLKAISAAPGLRGSAIAAAGLTNETAATNTVVKLAGIRGDDFTWNWDAVTSTATLASAADITDFAALGLTPGQVCHIGSDNGSLAIQNAFQNAAANDMFGYARVRSITAGSIVFDKVADALKFDDLTAPATLDLMFGRFWRNVPVNDSEFIERSLTFEAAWSNLADPGPGDEYEYSKGNFANQLQVNIPLTDKATMTVGFIGTDTDIPTATRRDGASTARQPQGTAAINTTSDIARLRITEIDEDGITTDFKSLTITLNNNVSAEKVLGTLGARFLNTGNFEVDVEAQVLFTSSAVTRAIRNNETLTMDFIVDNSDGSIAFDIPAMTLGDGSKELPVNESVLLNTTAEAFEDPTLGTSIGISEILAIP